jgi:hypothetical protein
MAVLACALVVVAPRYENIFNFVRTKDLGVASMHQTMRDLADLSHWAKDHTDEQSVFLFINEKPSEDANVRLFWLLSHRSVGFCSKPGGGLAMNDWSRLIEWNERRKLMEEATPSSWKRLIAELKPPLYIVTENETGSAFCRNELHGRLSGGQGPFTVWKI